MVEIYYNNKWSPWKLGGLGFDGILYNYGTYNSDYFTSDYITTASQQGSITKNTGDIYFLAKGGPSYGKDIGYIIGFFNKKIEISNYSKLQFTFKHSSIWTNSYGFTVGFSSNSTTTDFAGLEKSINVNTKVTTEQTMELDISELKGEYYLYIGEHINFTNSAGGNQNATYLYKLALIE